MKKTLITICLIVLAAALSGCTEYAAGFGSGATAMKIMSDEAQENFIAAVNELNATTALIEGEIDGIALPSVKPETVATVESLKEANKNGCDLILKATKGCIEAQEENARLSNELWFGPDRTELEEKIKKLEGMIEHGIGFEDLVDDH